MYKNRPNQITGAERSKQLMAQEELIEQKKKELEMKIKIKSIGKTEDSAKKTYFITLLIYKCSSILSTM